MIRSRERLFDAAFSLRTVNHNLNHELEKRVVDLFKKCFEFKKKTRIVADEFK